MAMARWDSSSRPASVPSLKHERLCLAPVAGVDEAGRGPLAGPVVAAAVILPAKGVPRGLDDSKRVPAAERARLAGLLHARAAVGVGIVEPHEIDTLNIHWATMKAMTLAVEALVRDRGVVPAHVLVDGNRLPRWTWAATAIVGGDGHSLSIAAASISAICPSSSAATLREHGPSPLHRRSFAPVAAAVRAAAESFAPHPSA